MRVFGLIGYPLGHSFSGKYFSEKFKREGITDCEYRLFPIPQISRLPEIIHSTPELRGLNVTIPYKEQVLAFVNTLDPIVSEVGACNCLKIEGSVIKGFNTDVAGFRESLQEKLKPHHDRALVLGTGGASKAVAYVLKQSGIPFTMVSRTPGPGQVSYASLTREDIRHHPLIINTTPLGTAPDVDHCPDIPYNAIGNEHYLFDLVYNPSITQFLKNGLAHGAAVKNGSDMLAIQAEESWKIWER